MKRAILGVITAGVLLSGGVAAADPAQKQPQVAAKKLSPAQLAKVSAGTITKTNGGGKTPNGEANGIDYTNPAGHAPGGWN